jgi:hypothetical protein
VTTNAWKWTQMIVLASAVAACGDDGGRPSPDAGPIDLGNDAGPADLGRDAGPPDGGGLDTNNSFADAVTLTMGAATGATDTIGVVEDKDYFKFDATAGDWIIVTTTANPDDVSGMVDTVITMYDAAETQVAENDDAYPRTNTDSEIIYHVVTTGTYYVMVQDFSDWENVSPEAHPADTYEISAGTLNLTAASVTVDPETGNDLASATPLQFGTTGGGLLVGLFETATDVDVFSVTTAELQIFQAGFAPQGTTGYGSTTPPRAAWVTNAAGTEILARIPDVTISDEIAPPLPAGSYLLWVDRPTGTVGADDFYVSKVGRGTENPLEAAETTNGVVTTPEVITLTDTAATGTRRGFILATIGTGDTDYYAVDVLAGEQVAGVCGAETSGSGVRGLTLTLLDSTGATTLATATENTTDNGAIIAATTVTAPGRYLFRVTKTGQDATVTGTWARCGFRAAPPAAP